MGNERNATIFDPAEDLADIAASDPMRRWILGVLAAFAVATYGAYSVMTQRTWVPRTKPLGIHQWIGSEAATIGCMLLFIAAFMHSHWFWSSHPHWHGYGQLGKVAALIGLVASSGWLLYQVLR